MNTLIKCTPLLFLVILFSNCSKDESITPTACFLASETYVTVGQEIVFTSCSKDGNRYNWDFGDGITSKLANPTHTYHTNQEYTVKLTLSNGEGNSHSTSTIIDATKPKPIAMMVNKIVLTKWPETWNNKPWDNNDGPDMLPKITNSSRYLFVSDEIMNNVVSGNTYVFGSSAGLPVSVINVNQNIYVEWYDEDASGAQSMGSLGVNPITQYTDIDGDVIVFQDDNWEFSLEVSWSF